MRALALAGLIAIAFGLGSYTATGELRAFNLVNLGAGAAALLVAAGAGLRRLRGAGAPAFRRVLLRGLLTTRSAGSSRPIHQSPAQ